MSTDSQDGVRETLDEFLVKWAKEHAVYEDYSGLLRLAQAVQERTAERCAEIAWDAESHWDAKANILGEFNLKERGPR